MLKAWQTQCMSNQSQPMPPEYHELIDIIFNKPVGEKIVTISEMMADGSVWRTSSWDIHADGTVGDPNVRLLRVTSDPDDNKFLECADAVGVRDAIRAVFNLRIFHALDGASIIIRTFEDSNMPCKTIAAYLQDGKINGLSGRDLTAGFKDSDKSEVFQDWPNK